jgi:heterodisulfide reductase subunit C
MASTPVDPQPAAAQKATATEPVAAEPTAAPPPLTPGDTAFLAWVEKESDTSVSSCFQCQKCSNGCPTASWMDILPHQVVHRIRLGLKDDVLASRTIWLCADCKTCLTRCPNGIDIPRFMEALKRRAQREGVEAPEKHIPVFLGAFVDTIRAKGRLHELGMMRRYKLRTGDLFSDFKLGLRMFGKGKLKLFARKVKGIGEIRRIFEQTEPKP